MKNITRPIESLRKTAGRRLPGYMEACLRRGQISEDGKSITFTEKDFHDIRRTFNPRTGVAFLNPGCC